MTTSCFLSLDLDPFPFFFTLFRTVREEAVIRRGTSDFPVAGRAPFVELHCRWRWRRVDEGDLPLPATTGCRPAPTVESEAHPQH